MAIRLDRRLSYQNLFEWHLESYGFLEECIDCVKFDTCKHLQHGVNGLKDFYCADNPDMERR